jgi:signal transduction histidine kinase
MILGSSTSGHRRTSGASGASDKLKEGGKLRYGRRFDTQLAVGAPEQNDATARRRSERGKPAWLSVPDQTGLDGRAAKRSALGDQVAALEARNRELAAELEQLRAERREPGTQVASARNVRAIPQPRPKRTYSRLAGVDGERRRLARDLHDGVQGELVALIVELALAQQDPDTPPVLAGMLAGLEARAQAALDSVRNTVGGIYPPLLAEFGVQAALRAQAARAATTVSVVGAAPRSIEEAEEAVYFACSEAIQNVAKHAGRGARVTLRLHDGRGSLAVRIEDDGRGFDPANTPEGAGLRNIRDRVQHPGGTVEVTSTPGHGTVVTISLPWPPRAG